MKLSKNFTLDEMTFSPTAVRLGINNTPTPDQIHKLEALCKHVLQPVRDHFGKPVAINSGFRSRELNKAIGGAKDSQHMRGEAADIRVIGGGNDVVWQYIVDKLNFDQVILEHVPESNPHRGWVHVSFNFINRKQAFSIVGGWKALAGKYYA